MGASVPVIAVDGPSGSGKGTVSRLLAERLGWHLLDSGALYRLVAVAAEAAGTALDDSDGLAKLALNMDFEIDSRAGSEAIRLNGLNVTARLRMESAGEAASQVAALPAVREALIERQRSFARLPGLVADGRDMGSVVFPQAVLKLFLTASPGERAQRRHKQLKEKGIDVSLRGLSRDIARRDLRDENRRIAPLKPAHNARVIDSTSMSPEQVVELALTWLAEAGFGSSAT